MADYNVNERWSLHERAKATFIDGKSVLPIINTLNLKVDDFFKDVPHKPCNRGLTHVIRRAHEMPSSTIRKAYSGVEASNAGSQIVVEHVVPREMVRKVDEVVLTGMDEAGIAMELESQDIRQQRKLGEDMVNAFFNGGLSEDSADVKGLSQRLDTISGNTLENVVSCGNNNASYNSSIYIVEWNMEGDEGAFGIYPSKYMGKGVLGVKTVDFGLVETVDATNVAATMMMWTARHYGWTGLCVGDNLKIARLANINTDVGGANNFISGNGSRKMIQLLNNGHFDLSRTRIYCNADIKSQIDVLGEEKSNVNLTPVEVFGKWVDAWKKIPIRMLDNAILTSTEAVVS